ncbi:TonB-dependent receptor plug domain-containing protein [Pseudomarimonas arenosa]|uniref:TonB-dependent receptor n=1 Tax=Pseudomarimonas arenosa TaxID=2774145 RepID=A0AAW3ZMJ6_9GAMM|nr:TonB-dependent receptor [Pseudomarimonas arenosa]MBD8526958.1 TonB-dependent receptor [Pseudomarimonas arenosa]
MRFTATRKPCPRGLSLAIGLAILGGSALSRAEDAASLDTVEVTGSRLQRLDAETASPVIVIDQASIQRSGHATIADLLRESTANSFGSRRQQSGYAGGQQNLATINLRGLGQQRSLILVNGRRLANSPALPDTQNLALIPLAAVERVEILLDGASSIYGSDAVGGVVNIILKRNLDAHQVQLHFASPEQAGGEEQQVSLSGGMLGNGSSFSYALSHGETEAIFDTDRKLTAVGLSQYGFPASYTALASNPNPAGPTIVTVTRADSRCPDVLGGSAEFPNSVLDRNQCFYNFAASSNSIPQREHSALFFNGDWLSEGGTRWFSELSVSRAQSTGTYAPTPQVGGLPYFPTMAADNPNNPTRGQSFDFDTDGDGVADTTLSGPFDLQLYYRNVAGGNRHTDVRDDALHLLFGLEGRIEGWNADYDLALQHDRNETDEYTVGLARRDLLQAAIDNGSFDLFAVNGPTDLALAQSFVTDTRYAAEFELNGLDFTLRRPWLLDSGREIASAYGLDFKQHRYRSLFDDPFGGNLIDGRAGGGSAAGDRDIASAFTEFGIPLGERSELNLSLRWDQYSDFGGALSPRIGMVWRSSDSWLWRTSIGRGFRAPSLYELYSTQGQSFISAVDSLRCRALGDSDGDGTDDSEQPISSLPADSLCRPLVIQTITSGNPDLEAEDSDSLTFGTVFEPNEQFRLSLNYFYQRFDHQITVLPAFDLLDQEADDGSHPAVIRDATGQIIAIDQQYANYSGARAQGIDLGLRYRWSSPRWGEFSLGYDLSALLDYKVETVRGQGFRSVDGAPGLPSSKSDLSLSWQGQAYSAHLHMQIIPEMEQQDTELGSYYPVDLQLMRRIGEGARISFGVRNLFDKEPPSSANLGFPFYIVEIGDITGRTWYLRYQQEF